MIGARFVTTTAMTLWLLGASMADPRSARAGDRDQAAAEVFRAGSKAYERGEYRAAAVAFEAAFREVPHAASAYNAARAWERAGEPARAADLYRAAVELPKLTDGEKADAVARLAALEPTLGVVEVAAPAVVSVAHVARARAPVRVHLPPGEHEVRMELPDGREERKQIRVDAGQTVELAPPPGRADGAPLPRPVAQPRATAARAPADEGAASTLRITGWACIAGAAAAGGAAVVLGVMALDARDEFDATGWTDEHLHERADTLRTWTNVAWVGAGALAVAGGSFLLASRLTRRTTVGFGPRTVSLRARF